MRRHFDNELKKLNETLLRMSAFVEENIRHAMKSLIYRDKTLAEEVIRLDKEKIDTLEMEIDEKCLELLALHQPTAIDLRQITSTMKINNELERIGDQAVNIAERAMEIIRKPLLKPLIDIPKMADIAQEMVKGSIDSLVDKDEKMAARICMRDNAMDLLNHQIFRELITYMLEDRKNIKRAIQLILLARHLERIGDHATNIAEDVIYFLSGKDIKHRLNLGKDRRSGPA